MSAAPSPAASPVVIAGRDLARHYGVGRGLFRPRATVKAVDGVSFALAAGRTLAVVGESGSGKSTLARLVTLLEPPTSGSLAIDGRDATAGPGRADPADDPTLRRTVQMVFQNPYGSLNPRKTVGAILEEPLRINTALGKPARTEAARAMIAKVGLRPEHIARYPHMFSGGQRQRIAIARALMLSPRIVVADEPVSALDVSIRAQVLNLMLDLQRELGLAYLFISHDLSVVRHIADEVLVMYLGRTVEQGPKATIFARPRHPYTKALLASTPAVDPKHRGERIRLTGELPSPLDPPSGCAFRTRCPFATGECAGARPELREVAGRQVACHRVEAIG
ncbi:MAG: ABC transporter ATP-binding protein [Alphaproteobacteria bacterium]|nr:ABC transporter ATP-binding protein [Alphaproteobacteria bacterium]